MNQYLVTDMRGFTHQSGRAFGIRQKRQGYRTRQSDGPTRMRNVRAQIVDHDGDARWTRQRGFVSIARLPQRDIVVLPEG